MCICIIFNYVCLGVCVCTRVCAHGGRCLQQPEVLDLLALQLQVVVSCPRKVLEIKWDLLHQQYRLLTTWPSLQLLNK